MMIRKIMEADSRFQEAMKTLETIRETQNEKEREKEIDKASRLIISVAYDKAEMYECVAFQLLNAADILLRTSSDLLKTVEPKAKYNDKFKIKESKRMLQKMIDTFEKESIAINEDYFHHGYTENSDLNVFDAISQNSTLVLCFILLCYNSINQNGNNAKQIEAYLKRAKGGKPLFSQEEIESFKGNF